MLQESVSIGYRNDDANLAGYIAGTARGAGRGGDVMTVCTPMGPAAPGSRLERRGEAARIVNKLLEAGWRRSYLAEELGVSVNTLGRWRDGKSLPSYEQLERLRFYVRD